MWEQVSPRGQANSYRTRRPVCAAPGLRLGLLGMLFVLAALGSGVPDSLAGDAITPTPAKSKLAVIPFTGSSDPEEYGAALGQALRYGFQQVRSITLVSSGQIVESFHRLGLSSTEGLSDESLLLLARDLEVNGLVTGTYVTDGETVTVRACLVSPAGRGQVVHEEAISGPMSAYLAAPQRILADALQRFQVRRSQLDDNRLRQAFSGEPTSLAAYILYARAAWEQGLGTREGHLRALALLTQGMELDPNFAQAHILLGTSLLTTDNPSKAFGEFRDAIAINPRLPEAHKLLGDLLVTMPTRPYTQAIQAYVAALDLAPDYSEARLGLGDAHQAQGRIEAAIAEYELVLATDPESARGHYGLGKIYYAEKDLYHEAVAEFQRAITLEPRLLEAHLSLGELYEEKGLYQEAIERYRSVLSIDPQHPGAAYGLALAYEHVDIPRAIEQWESYIDLASSLQSEKDWVGIAKKHLEKLRRGGKPRS
jgi:tetratricopeptide (TPR) repeat protein